MLLFSSPGDQRRDRLTQGSHRFKLSEGAGVLGVGGAVLPSNVQLQSL